MICNKTPRIMGMIREIPRHALGLGAGVFPVLVLGHVYGSEFLIAVCGARGGSLIIICHP